MNNQFVPYGIALQLKELGFDEPCFGFWEKYLVDSNFDLFIEPTNKTNAYFIRAKALNSCLAPLYQQAFKWFSKTYGFRSNLDSYAPDQPNTFNYIYVIKRGDGFDTQPFYSGTFNTEKEAEIGCLLKLIKMAKEGWEIKSGGTLTNNQTIIE